MRKLILIGMVLSGLAVAAPPNTLRQHFDRAARNILENGGFENGFQRWAASDSADATLDSTTPLYGDRSVSWDCNSASDTFDSSSTAVPIYARGAACVAEMAYKWPTGTLGHIDFTVYDGSSVLVSKTIEKSSGSSLVRAEFTCPSAVSPAAGSSVMARLDCQNASAAAITLDEFYIGPNLDDRDGLYKSPDALNYKIGVATVDATSTVPLLVREQGNWIDEPLVDVGQGIFTIPFQAGFFTGTPYCLADGDGTNGTSDSGCNVDWTTSTKNSVTVRCITASTGAARDVGFNLLCVGP